MSLETNIMRREVARLQADNASLSGLLALARAELDAALLHNDRLSMLVHSLRQSLQAMAPQALQTIRGRSE